MAKLFQKVSYLHRYQLNLTKLVLKQWQNLLAMDEEETKTADESLLQCLSLSLLDLDIATPAPVALSIDQSGLESILENGAAELVQFFIESQLTLCQLRILDCDFLNDNNQKLIPVLQEFIAGVPIESQSVFVFNLELVKISNQNFQILFSDVHERLAVSALHFYCEEVTFDLETVDHPIQPILWLLEQENFENLTEFEMTASDLSPTAKEKCYTALAKNPKTKLGRCRLPG